MACSLIDGRYLCSTWAEARRLDTARNGGWFGRLTDEVIEIAGGVGDAVTGLVAFPEDTARYVTGTDEFYGQRRSWSYFGDSAQFNWSMRNPVFRVMDVANSVVYGGVNLVLCYTPHSLSRELGLNVPYFSPPPATTRDAARDSVFLATILLGPTAMARGRTAMGLPEKTVPVPEGEVAVWARHQTALSRLSPDELAVERLFANPQAGAVGWRVGDSENYVPGGIQPKYTSDVNRWRTSDAENYVSPARNLDALYSEERGAAGDASVHQRVLSRLEIMAKSGSVDAVNALVYLGESRPELLDDVVGVLSGVGMYEAKWHISDMATRHPEAALRWPSVGR